MSLLPNNLSKKDQEFALFLDSNSRVDYSDLKIDVMTCDSSILSHIALIKGANIENMTELEAREYLKTFTKKHIGTVGAVKDAMNVCFDNAELVEWFNSENLQRGYFNINVYLKHKNIYDERLFNVSKRLIDNAKNVRSKLSQFDVRIPISKVDIKTNYANVFDYNFDSEIKDLKPCKNLGLLINNDSSLEIAKNLINSKRKTTLNLIAISSQNIKIVKNSFSKSINKLISLSVASFVNSEIEKKLYYKHNYSTQLNLIGGLTWNI